MTRVKIDPADEAFSWYVRLRDKICQRCESEVSLNPKGLPNSHHASHFQGRGDENTRFDEENVICLCHGCHAYFTARPSEHTAWQVERIGQEKVDELVLRSHMYKKKDREMMKLYWRQRLLEDFGIKV